MKQAEKAKQLFDTYLENMPMYLRGKLGRKTAKLNALFFVDEMLKELTELHHKTPLLFWRGVSQELNKLK